MIAILKIVVSASLIWAVSEIGKRSGKLGGLVLSLPLTSILAICWVWIETKDTGRIANLSTETLIFIVPSLVFFVVLSVGLTRFANFYISMVISILATLVAYAVFFKVRG